MQMLSQDATTSDDGAAQAQKFCDIIIIDLNNHEIPIKVRLLPQMPNFELKLNFYFSIRKVTLGVTQYQI
jgi:hypothetical protein